MTETITPALKRILTCTLDLLSERPGQQFSISEVAEMSRTSTATIYEKFSSKSELIFQAVAYYHRALSLPKIDIPADDSQAFATLVDYLERRIIFLSSTATRGSFIALITQERGPQLFDSLGGSGFRLHELSQVIAAATRAGELRKGDSERIAYGISTSTGFEPVIMNLIRNVRTNIADVLEQALDPFVTQGGRKKLKAAIEACRSREIDDPRHVRSWIARDPVQ